MLRIQQPLGAEVTVSTGGAIILARRLGGLPGISYLQQKFEKNYIKVKLNTNPKIFKLLNFIHRCAHSLLQHNITKIAI